MPTLSRPWFAGINMRKDFFWQKGVLMTSVHAGGDTKDALRAYTKNTFVRVGRAGTSPEDPDLWAFAWQLQANSEDVKARVRDWEDFSDQLRPVLQTRLDELVQRCPQDFPHWNGNMIQVYKTGSLGNKTDLDGSDLDIFIVFGKPVTLREDGSSSWDPNQSEAIRPAVVVHLTRMFAGAMQETLEGQWKSKFELSSFRVQGKTRFTIASKGGLVKFECDLLPALRAANDTFLLISEDGNLVRSANELASSRLDRLSADFKGLREMIKTLKLVNKAASRRRPDMARAIPSCAFETIVMELAQTRRLQWWDTATFCEIFRASLETLRDAIQNDRDIPPPNNPDADVLFRLRRRNAVSPEDHSALDRRVKVVLEFLQISLSIEAASLKKCLDDALMTMNGVSGSSSPDEATPRGADQGLAPENVAGSGAIEKVLAWTNDKIGLEFRRSSLEQFELLGNINCVSVIGPSGSGKSFLLNSLLRLTGEENKEFRCSRDTTGTTIGIDVYGRPVQLSKFALNSSVNAPLLLFDVEGLGHKDTKTMASILLPAMMTSQVIIFNVKERARREQLLTDIAVYAELAHAVRKSQQGAQQVFGHLAIVLRDWVPSQDDKESLEEVQEFLLNPENDDDAQAQDRNRRRRIIGASFRGVTLHGLPIPFQNVKSMMKSVIPWSDVPPDFFDELKRIFGKLAGFFQSQLPWTDEPLTGPSFVEVFGRIVEDWKSNENLVDASSLVTLMHKDRCQRAKDALFSRYVVHMREQIRPKLPVERQILQQELDKLLDESLSEFKARATGIYEEIVTPIRDELRARCAQVQADALEENLSKIQELCKQVISAVVTSVLHEQFLAPQPSSVDALERVIVKDLETRWPSLADKGAALEEARREAVKQLRHWYKPPSHSKLKAILQNAVFTALSGDVYQAMAMIREWHSFLLKGTAAELVEYASIVRRIRAQYDGGYLEGLFLEQAYHQDKESFASDPALLCDFAHHCTLSRNFKLAEDLYSMSVDVEKARKAELSSAYVAFADYWMICHDYEKALGLYEQALQHKPLSKTVFHDIPICLKSLGRPEADVSARTEELIEVSRKESTEEVYLHTILRLWKADVLKEVRAEELLRHFEATHPENGFGLAGLFQLLLFMKKLEDLETLVPRVMNHVGDIPSDARVTVGVDLGRYWWKFAPKKDIVLAEQYLTDAVLRTTEFLPFGVLQDFFSETGQHHKLNEWAKRMKLYRTGNTAAFYEEHDKEIDPEIDFAQACELEDRGQFAKAEHLLRGVWKVQMEGRGATDHATLKPLERLIHLVDHQGGRDGEVKHLQSFLPMGKGKEEA
jgi:energy-coupling factor transporter ATP-binding protein EcfA2